MNAPLDRTHAECLAARDAIRAHVAQIRTELSYVWGYHEIGYWGAHNILDQISIFAPRRRTPSRLLASGGVMNDIADSP